MSEQINDNINNEKENSIETYEVGLPGAQVEVANSSTGDQLEVNRLDLEKDGELDTDSQAIAEVFKDKPDNILRINSKTIEVVDLPKEGDHFLITPDNQVELKKKLDELDYNVDVLEGKGLVAKKGERTISFVFAETPEDKEKREKEEDKEKPKDLNKKVKNRAMIETLNYFEGRLSNLTNYLSQKKEAIANFLSKTQSIENINSQDLEKITNPELGLDKNMIKTVLEKIMPVKDQNSATELFIKMVEEANNPSKLLGGEEKAFAEGKSWYQTTPEGRATLENIKNKVSVESNKSEDENN